MDTEGPTQTLSRPLAARVQSLYDKNSSGKRLSEVGTNRRACKSVDRKSS